MYILSVLLFIQRSVIVNNLQLSGHFSGSFWHSWFGHRPGIPFDMKLPDALFSSGEDVPDNVDLFEQ